VDYKEIKLIDKTIKVRDFCADKLQEEFDSFVTMVQLMGYETDEDLWDYFNGDFIEYDFVSKDLNRFRILFHINKDDELLKQIDFYLHNSIQDVTFKTIVQGLRYDNGGNFHKEIEGLFKIAFQMA